MPQFPCTTHDRCIQSCVGGTFLKFHYLNTLMRINSTWTYYSTGRLCHETTNNFTLLALLHVAHLASTKKQKHYSTPMCWLKCNFSFTILDSVILCVGDSDSSYHSPRCALTFSEDHLSWTFTYCSSDHPLTHSPLPLLCLFIDCLLGWYLPCHCSCHPCYIISFGKKSIPSPPLIELCTKWRTEKRPQYVDGAVTQHS